MMSQPPVANCTRIPYNTSSKCSMNPAAANLLEAFPNGRQAGKELSAGLSVSIVRPEPQAVRAHLLAEAILASALLFLEQGLSPLYLLPVLNDHAIGWLPVIRLFWSRLLRANKAMISGARIHRMASCGWPRKSTAKEHIPCHLPPRLVKVSSPLEGSALGTASLET
jgi:hypothetical protein